MFKIAIPLANGQLCMHFGHCEEFAVIDTDENTKEILKIEKLVPPPHEPGVIPRWIGSIGVNLVIAGGMGAMAQKMLASQGVEVFAGASLMSVEELVGNYFAGTLVRGVNACDHGSEGHSCNH